LWLLLVTFCFVGATLVAYLVEMPLWFGVGFTGCLLVFVCCLSLLVCLGFACLVLIRCVFVLLDFVYIVLLGFAFVAVGGVALCVTFVCLWY